MLKHLDRDIKVFFYKYNLINKCNCRYYLSYIVYCFIKIEQKVDFLCS